MRPIELFDVFAPVLMVALAIALVAGAYFAFTAIKDRVSLKREERQLEDERSRRAPRR